MCIRDRVYYVRVIKVVVLTTQAKKDLRKVPVRIAMKFRMWVTSVELEGLQNIRKIPGYHDEPLRGKRKGQRSIRLSKQYRAFYIVNKNDTVEFVSVEEINKHDY